jgi:sodium transport system ATP-binding protein
MLCLLEAINSDLSDRTLTSIRTTQLSKIFTSAEGRDVVAVDSVSFNVASGEVFGLLGANGAGKTTTLRMMLGLLQPTSGDASIDGCSVADYPDQVKRLVGFVSTSVGVYQWLTPREMLLFVGDLYDVPMSVCRDRVDELAALLDFESFIDRRCGVLSTGQKQRINLARALIHDPPVMLLDEPTRGLDIVGSQVIFNYIQHLKSAGKAVVICTHRLDEAERFGDRFGLMHHGAMPLAGTLDELQSLTGDQGLTNIFIGLMESAAQELSE